MKSNINRTAYLETSLKGQMLGSVPVEGLDSSEQLLVVTAVDEDLSVVLDGLGEHRQRARVELLFFSFLELLRAHLRLGLCQQTPEKKKNHHNKNIDYK